TFEPLDPARLSSADLVFLALPHEESAAVSAALPAGVPVVDLSASFRLADPQAWSVYYRTPHAGQWCYGLPELPGARERIAAARRRAGRVVHPGAGPDAPRHPGHLHRTAARPGHGHRGAAGGARGRL